MSVTDDRIKNGIERYHMLFGFINDVDAHTFGFLGFQPVSSHTLLHPASGCSPPYKNSGNVNGGRIHLQYRKIKLYK